MAETLTAGRLRLVPPGGVGRLSLAATMAVLEYCALSYRRNWRGTLFMTFLSPILFLGAMGFGLGSFVNTGSAASLANGYAAFLAPGLLAATCMQTGAFEATYPIMARLIWTKVYHAMLATSIAVIDVVAGQLSWFAIRLTLVATAYFVVMVAFGLVHGGPA